MTANKTLFTSSSTDYAVGTEVPFRNYDHNIYENRLDTQITTKEKCIKDINAIICCNRELSRLTVLTGVFRSLVCGFIQ